MKPQAQHSPTTNMMVILAPQQISSADANSATMPLRIWVIAAWGNDAPIGIPIITVGMVIVMCTESCATQEESTN